MDYFPKNFCLINFNSLGIIINEQKLVTLYATLKGELTKKFLFLFSLDQVSLISLLKYFPSKMSLT